MNDTPQDQAGNDKEPFAMIPKRVLAAPLLASAKLVFAVLNGEPSARRNAPVHLTQEQIAVRSGLAERTVGTALRALADVGLVSIVKQPAANGWQVHSYLVHDVRTSSVPEMPDLPGLGPHMRQVLNEHLLSSQSPAAQPTRLPAQAAELAPPVGKSDVLQVTSTAPEGGRTYGQEESEEQGEEMQEEEQEAAASPRPVLVHDPAHGHALDYTDDWSHHPDQDHIKDALRRLLQELVRVLDDKPWRLDECNALIEAAWPGSTSPVDDVERVLRVVRQVA